jgi:hypothetical protein
MLRFLASRVQRRISVAESRKRNKEVSRKRKITGVKQDRGAKLQRMKNTENKRRKEEMKLIHRGEKGFTLIE